MNLPPLHIQVENTSTCNAKCGFCPYPTSMRWGGLMDMGLYKKIVDEVATIPLIRRLTINGLGEPLLDAKFIERIAYARQVLPDRFIDTYTNGSYLTPTKLDAMRDAGLDLLNVSLNAISREQRKRIMQLDDYDRVCGYLDYAIANRGKMNLYIKTVVNNKEFTDHDGAIFYARWGAADAGGYGVVVWEGNWAGNGETAGPPRVMNAMCHRALRQIYITWDGRVTPCCFMPDADIVCYGDLKKQTIRDVYQGDEYATFREKHSLSQGKDYSFCAGCTGI